MKPFSDACEENKQPILQVIQQYFSKANNILEIGSGTGQHAVFFAKHLNNLTWHSSDVAIYHDGIKQWLADYPGNNIKGPYLLDVNQADWPSGSFDGIFSANTTHIMSWPDVVEMFKGIGQHLHRAGFFCLYGPFNYHGNYTSASNQRFDQFLKQRDSKSGLRDIDDLTKLATAAGLEFIADHEMPVNNRTLVWRKN